MILKYDNNLSLELLSAKHAEQIFHLVEGNRVHLREWLPWVDHMKTLGQFQQFILTSMQRWEAGSEIPFMIMQNDIAIGRVGIYHIDAYNKIGSIGYWLGKDFSGQGLITKVCSILIDYAFEKMNLNRIEIKCGTKNNKSKAIAERLQFTQEGIIRQGEFVNNSFIDLYLFSMLKHEWAGVSK